MATPRRRSEPNLEHHSLLAGSVVLLLVALVGIGGPRNWWSRNLQLSFRTTSAAGIQQGMPVMISGFPVGRVQRINLLPNAQVQVTLIVAAEQRNMIGQRSRATLAQDTLLGNAYIAISPDLSGLGPGNGRPQQTVLSYEPSPDIASLIKDVAATRIPLQQVLSHTAGLMEKRLPRSLDQLDATLSSGQRLAGTLERELVGQAGSLGSNVSTATSNLERTLGSLQQTLQEIQSLARSSNALLQNLNRSWLMQMLEPATPSARDNDDQAPGPGPGGKL